MSTPSPVSAIKLALVAKNRRAETGATDPFVSEPIAIVGMGCRFPGGATSPERFWELLRQGRDAVREIPAERWPIGAYYDADPGKPGKMSTRWAGLLDRLDEFDAEYFGIAPREAADMDPQQRLLLEVTWEAFNDAGMPPEDLGGSATGVFFAIYNTDYARLQFSDPASINAHTSSGTSHGVAAGRVSYLLNLRGPSLAVDTACSSSLVAIHLACQSLRAGESSLAIAGGVNALVTPEETISLSRWGMLAPDGRCKTFDASANGFVRGEGCGVVVLKRLADALADGDRIHAVIRGSAVNQDGRSTVLTAPNGLAQQAVLRQALKNACVAPGQVSYVEAHGTGTSVGDPIEVEALSAVLGAPRADGSRCRIGSVKTNFGHLEAAAGVAGLIKVVLAMRHGTIPPHLHFNKLSPLISIEGTCLEIGAAAAPWRPGTRPRIAGLSSFGFGGTNAHVVIEEPPQLPASEPVPGGSTAGPWVLTLSARTPDGVRALAQGYADLLADPSQSAVSLYDLCRTAALRRRHFAHRMAFVAGSVDELLGKLRAFLAATPAGEIKGRIKDAKLLWLFCGHGSHWAGMGRGLLESEEVFRKSLEACDKVIQPLAGWSVITELKAEAAQSRLDQTEIFQPVLFSLQVALAALFKAWGVVPDAVMGHSVGEIAAAHVAGAIPLEDAAKIAVLRGRHMQRSAPEGAMAAIEMSVDEARTAFLTRWPQLRIAAINAPRSLTISGPAAAIDEAVAAASARQLFARRLQVNRAFHGPDMEATATELRRQIAGISPTNTKTVFYSTVEGRAVEGRGLDADYWARNVLEPVNFCAAVTAAIAGAHGVVMEIGPHPVLAASVKACAEASGRDVSLVASLRRNLPASATAREAAASLYALGRNIAWKALFPRETRPVSLPPYPWQRDRHWTAASPHPGAPEAGADRASPGPAWPGRPLHSPFLRTTVMECIVSETQPSFLREHRVCGRVTMPATGWIDLALAAVLQARSNSATSLPIRLESLAIEQPLVVDGEDRYRIHVGIDDAGDLRIASAPAAGDAGPDAWTMHASGRVPQDSGERAAHPERGATLESFRARCPREVELSTHFRDLEERGVAFGPQFRGLSELWAGDDAALGHVGIDGSRTADPTGSAAHPGLLDACLQTIAPLLPTSAGSDGSPVAYLPIGIERLTLHARLPDRVWSLAEIQPGAGHGDVVANLHLLSEGQELLCSISGLRLRRTEKSRLERAMRRVATELLYAVEWVPSPREPGVEGKAARGPARGAIIAGSAETAQGIAAALASCDIECTSIVIPAPAASGPDALSKHVLDTRGRLAGLADAVRSGCIQHVIHATALDLPAERPTGATESAVQALTCGTALAAVQALAAASAPTPPRLWLITRNAVALTDAAMHPAQAPLCGLAATLALEHPQLRPTHVDLANADDRAAFDELAHEIASGSPEDRVALTPGNRRVARLHRLPRMAEVPPAETLALFPSRTGVLDDAVWTRVPRRRPGPGEVEIEVSHAGLNFRDVLTALGVVEGRGGALGGECAGRIIAAGPGVAGLQPGDRVIAFAVGGLSEFVTVPVELVAPQPEGVAAEQAAGLPVVFLTALYALHHVTSLKPGQRILIHAGAGGVGLCAVQLARRAGAEIFATASTPEKRSLLKAWGVQHVFNSRTLEFADQIRGLIGERGLDLVLNSLADEFIPRSLELIRAGGTFIELGKRGILDPRDVSARYQGVTYKSFDLADIAAESPKVVQSLLAELTRLLAAREIQPPPSRCFAARDIGSALRHMAQGQHIGKVVIDLTAMAKARGSQNGECIQGDATYVITGGLGALGLHLARWLLERGAKSLALIGRRPADAASESRLAELRAGGARVEYYGVDVGDRAALATVLDTIRHGKHPLRGVIHAAGTIADATVMQLDWAKFTEVMRPKLDGAWNLHELTQGDPLDIFVLFSSGAAILGSPGQGNYAAANAFLDALARFRAAQGLPALSIDWGAWSEGGMASGLSSQLATRLEARGMRAIAPQDACAALEDLLRRGRPHAAVMAVDWQKYVRGMPAGVPPPFLRDVVATGAKAESTVEAKTPAVRAQLLGLPPAHRLRHLQSLVEARAAQALGLHGGRSINPGQPLQELGLDSLMSVELRNSLATALECSLPPTLLFDFPTIESLAAHLAVDVLHLEAGEHAISDVGGAPADSEARKLAELSEEDAESLLLAELNQVKKDSR